MAEDNFTLTTIYANWKTYQEHIRDAIAPLTAEQLELRAAPNLRSIGEIAAHIIGCRLGWFIYTLGEDADEFAKQWNPDAPTHTASEMVQGMDATWQMMAERLARWSDDDMRQEFPDEWEDGKIVQLSRAWIVYHVMEHDLHHGGELALTLGMNGLESNFPG